jgi:hypothetical protein
MNQFLVPLRIPTGWAVNFNAYFADVPMDVRDGWIENCEYFKEDLLWIQQLRFVDGRHEDDPAGWSLDLGWYPQSDPNGAYTLTLNRGGVQNDVSDGSVFHVRDPNAQKIRAALERILDGLSEHEDVARLRDAVGAAWADGMPAALQVRDKI